MIESVLKSFLFSEHLLMIGLITLVMFLGNLFGGLLYPMLVAYRGPARKRKLTDRISFRLCMASELFLFFYAFYYHAVLIKTIELAHFVYWVFSLLMLPLLAVFGTTITGMIFNKRIEANKKEYRRRVAVARAAKTAKQGGKKGATASSRRGPTPRPPSPHPPSAANR